MKKLVLFVLICGSIGGCSSGPKTYEGEYKNGKYHGQGTATWSDSKKFTGQWKDGEPYNGTMTYKDGTKYTGQFYKIGDTGPAGGHVFYDKGEHSNGWRWMEAGPKETEFRGAKWSGYQYTSNGWIRMIEVRTTSKEIGSGKNNTANIVTALQEYEKGFAAQRCAELNFGGYKDWFLPSEGELKLMYRNLRLNRIGFFGNGWYWSSSEYYKYTSGSVHPDGHEALGWDFSGKYNLNKYDYPKAVEYMITRPARQF